MTKESEAMKEAVVTLHSLTEDEKIKVQCMARKRFEADRKSIFMSGKAEGLKCGIDQGIQALILDNMEEQKTDKQILEKLRKRFSLSEEEAEACLLKYGER